MSPEFVQIVCYAYDFLNRWVGETVTNYDSSGNATVALQEEFAYDGNQIVLSFDGTGSLTSRYLWGPTVDQLLAQDVPAAGQTTLQGGSATDWALTDNFGSVRDLATYDPTADG